MDFFEHQDKARRRTGVLVLLFALAVVLIVATVYVSVTAAFLIWSGRRLSTGMWNPELLLAIGGAVLGTVAIASAGKLLSLRGGGQAVAEMMGGRLILPTVGSAADHQLLNVVSEMALASGVAVPLVYVIDGEPGINAFAAGHGPEDAAVVVTSGLLEHLNRDELQGVIAHEFSHILNRDVRLNLRLTGMVFGILFLGIAGRTVLRTFGRGRIRSSGRNEGGGIAIVFIIALLLIVIGYIGTALGRIIQSAVSRQREFLADASAVQFTRNPGGISGALKKIGVASHGSNLRQPKSEEISHFFFASYKPFNALRTLWATHPPLDERIKRIDPSFEGSYQTQTAAPSLSAGVPAMGFSDHDVVETTPLDVVESVGASPWDTLPFDDIVQVEVPLILMEEVQNGFGAVCTTYALLLSEREETRTVQLQKLQGQLSNALFENTVRLYQETSKLDTHVRLPLLDLATPSLRQISRSQYLKFKENIDLLIRTDNFLSVFEHSLRLIMEHRLDTSFGVRKRSVGGSPATHLVNVLATLSRISSTNSGDSSAAFDAGMVEISASRKVSLPTSVLPQQFDDALIALGGSDYKSRKKIVRACAAVVLHDEEVTLDEAEILRAVIEALNCPLPPFLPSAFKAA